MQIRFAMLPRLYLGLLVFTWSARAADRPYPLLVDTPPYVCEQLLYGDKFGSSYDGPTFRRIKRVLEWRYDVELIGLDEVLAKPGGAFFLPNHSTPADPAVVLIAIGGRTRLRPLVTGNLKNAPLLSRVYHGSNAFIQAEPINGGFTAVKLLEATIREMANAVRHGDNVLFYPSGYAQTQMYDHLSAQTMVHRLLAIDPDARFVLVRERGLWGSGFSHGARSSRPNKQVSTNAAILRGLANGAAIALTNGPWTPKRKVTFEFVEPADFPRRGSVAEINAYLTKFYAGGAPETRAFVKGHALWPGATTTTSDAVIDYGPAPQQWSTNSADASTPVDAQVRARVSAILRREFGTDEQPRLAERLDSIARVHLFLALEERFGVRLPDDAHFGDVDDLTRLIAAAGERPPAVERAITAGSAWFGPATQGPGPTLAHAIRVTRLARRLKRSPDAVIGVLEPARIDESTLRAVVRKSGKTVMAIDPGEDGATVVRRLDEAGVRQILTTRAYLDVISASFDLSRYLERFVILE